MKRGRKPTKRNVPKAVTEACHAICAKGERPTIRSVRAWLVKRDGSAPSLTDIAPPVKAWKLVRADSKAVDAVLRAYGALDAEQQKFVRNRIGFAST